jgi:NAD(P)-dependent dehydrogenase (short-subunit alcohol dehydrogenase family)
MNLDLEGRRVLVTGGSKGIGLACAKAFLAEGTRAAIASRSASNLAAARAALGEVTTVAADLGDAAAARAMVERVEAELGAIDILVTSAGAASAKPRRCSAASTASRSDGWQSRRRSPRWWSSPRRRAPATSPARSSQWTAQVPQSWYEDATREQRWLKRNRI